MIKETITGNTKTIIELTQGKFVLVQGIIGRMAASKQWDYNNRGQIQSNTVVDGKRQKIRLIRYLLGLQAGDGVRAAQVSKDTIEYQGKVCINYLINNLKTNRKGFAIHKEIHSEMARMGFFK